MARNKPVAMICKLSEEPVDWLGGIAMEYLDLNTEVAGTAPKSCPCCGAANAHFIKRGFSGRKQRYQSKICGKRFTFDLGKSPPTPISRRKPGRLLSATCSP